MTRVDLDAFNEALTEHQADFNTRFLAIDVPALAEEVECLRAIVTRFAGIEPIEGERREIACVLCDVKLFEAPHRETCPWRMAMEALGFPLPTLDEREEDLMGSEYPPEVLYPGAYASH